MTQMENTDALKKALCALAAVFYDYGKAHGADGTLYTVGGYVRNVLLGLPISDIDTCSALTPNQVIELCRENGFAYVPKGIDFGMVEIHFVFNGFKLYTEHTTFRADTYCEGGFHKPTSITFSKTPADDAFRRDFTVNALYQNPITNEIIDPTGGLSDLNAKIIRATSTPPDIIIHDDALRILRMVRFSCELDFSIDPATFECARQHVNNLKNISGERLRDELIKILLSDIKYPRIYEGRKKPEFAECHVKDKAYSVDISLHTPETSPVLRGLLTLRDLGVFGVIIPELEACRGYAQKPKYHKYDVMEHILRVTAETPPIIHLRLAGLFHDIGKPEAHVINDYKNMHGHDALSAPKARDILTRLRCPTQLINRVCKLVAIHMYDKGGSAAEAKLRMRFAVWGEATSCDMVAFRRADVLGSGFPMRDIGSYLRFNQVYFNMRADGAPFSAEELEINGSMILRELHISPSPLIGRIKTELLKHCAVHPEDNRRDVLLKLSAEMYNRFITEEL